MFNAVNLEHFEPENLCVRCNADLTNAALPKPVTCEFSGLMCYNPCGKSKKPAAEGLQPCKLRKESAFL